MRSFLILLTATGLLAIISLLPLEDISGGRLHSFSLVSDLTGNAPSVHKSVSSDNDIDPELLAAESETESRPTENREITDTAGSGDSNAASDNRGATATYPDGLTHNQRQHYEDTVISATLPPVKPTRDGDIVTIEDYTPSGQGLRHLRRAIESHGTRTARIAFVGDSYIEGDIFTQNVRELLQDTYGGEGVGYVNMYTPFPGFRQSVTQSGKGWNVTDIRNKSHNRECISITQQYSQAQDGTTAMATYKGAKKLRHTDKWSRSRFLFISPENCEVRTRLSGGDWITHDISGDPHRVQHIEIDGDTDRFSVSVDSPSMKCIGVWLDSQEGVSVDCISSRGFSGVTLRNISSAATAGMRPIIDYDLIVLEFGINAMSEGRRDYSSYSRIMTHVIEHIRECYPDSDVLLMGVGDRGQKDNGKVISMIGIEQMIEAQRDAARATGILFWDTREAMGGTDAIARWAGNEPPLANKDYVHLNHRGGKVLAETFVKSLHHALH